MGVCDEILAKRKKFYFHSDIFLIKNHQINKIDRHRYLHYCHDSFVDYVDGSLSKDWMGLIISIYRTCNISLLYSDKLIEYKCDDICDF